MRWAMLKQTRKMGGARLERSWAAFALYCRLPLKPLNDRRGAHSAAVCWVCRFHGASTRAGESFNEGVWAGKGVPQYGARRLPANMGAVQTRWFSADDELLARLQAPPDLSDGVESLAYWRGRRARLPWYRARARREASRMILVWERRLLAAVLAQRGTPLWARARAARLVAVGPLWRWARRGGFVLAAAMLTLLAPAVLVAELLVRSI